MKLRITKMVLWCLAGLGATVMILRIIHGPGSVTVLTDIIPWGLWKGWGVVALVPIGGAGFTLAMLVYIFRMRTFKPVVRGAVLLGLLCYSSVAVGLSMDIGIWWRIVFPVFHWQFHSVLFEIAWCIMLYLMVLMVEFAHTVVAKFGWRRVLGVLEKFTIVFVVFGISLSTLHQSSLGTLFLATPFRLHPLWYTDLLPLLFFVSSMGLGCLTISFLTLIVYWLYGGEPPMKAIAGLGRISAFLLLGYLGIKFIEIVASGEGPLLFAPGWDTANFWIEVLLSGAVPAVLLMRRRFRESKTAMFWISLCAIVGMSLNRVNVAGLATLSLTHTVYIPAWTEWLMTLGILSAAGLFFMFCVEYFGLFEGIGRECVEEWIRPDRFDHADWKSLYFGGQRAGSLRLYSLVFILGAAVSFGLMPHDAVFGVTPEKTPVHNPRWVEAEKLSRGVESPAKFAVPARIGNPHPADSSDAVMMLDGNRDGRYVLFDHDEHVRRYDNKKSCSLCHHMRKPYDTYTGCYRCHTDMYLAVDIFDHDLHMRKTGGNRHCADCHREADMPKVREHTRACLDCHKSMVAAGSRVQPDSSEFDSKAVGYMDALHTLCITCHREVEAARPELQSTLSRCTACHQELPDLSDDVWASRL